jgi:hypothetical protein
MPVARCEKSQWAFLLAQLPLSPFPLGPRAEHFAQGTRLSLGSALDSDRVVGARRKNRDW